MIRNMISIVVIAVATYVSLQTEVKYYGTTIDFFINMVTHFLGGCFTAVGILIIRDFANMFVAKAAPFLPSLRRLTIPVLPLAGLIFSVFVVGTVWEVWEVIFKESTFYSIDTLKDVIMDMCGAAVVSLLLGTYQHD